MNREDRQLIQSWKDTNTERGEGFMDTFSLVININKANINEAKEKSEVDEDDFFEVNGDWFIVEAPPTFAYDVYPKSLMEWACSYWKLKPEWVLDVSIQD